jgi:hypothetical protein
MQKLPIGIQDFQELRQGNYLYIDKTESIYQLMQGKYYFLSRPRRFGKSLLISTLKEIFLGNKDLFSGLWIEEKITWEKHPIIHFDFASASFKEIGLENVLQKRLDEIATQYQIGLQERNLISRFEELIRKLAEKENKVVILIDEYDRPMTEYLNNIPQAEANRETIKDFFSVIKPNDAFIRFFFMTGVSKFNKVSMFSGFNNLNDISYDNNYATLLGYTQEELEQYFADYLSDIAKQEKITVEELLPQIKFWYNGYNWGGETGVYNPFSILCFTSKRAFANYWFETGTPTFLVKLINEKFLYDFEEILADESIFSNFRLDALDAVSLLLQTGYLTVKRRKGQRLYLGYPNHEVRQSLIQHLLAGYMKETTPSVSPLVWQIADAFAEKDLEKVVKFFNIVFANIPYQIFEEKSERYYHAIIFLVFLLIGYEMQSEVSTSEGRIDAVLQTEKEIYVIEFKVEDSAEVALAQIKEKKYYEKYLHLGKTILLLGFSCKNKGIKEWKLETLER